MNEVGFERWRAFHFTRSLRTTKSLHGLCFSPLQRDAARDRLSIPYSAGTATVWRSIYSISRVCETFEYRPTNHKRTDFCCWSHFAFLSLPFLQWRRGKWGKGTGQSFPP